MTETTTTTTTTDPRNTLRSMVRGYCGADAPEGFTGSQLRERLRGTDAYKGLFAKLKDEGLVLEEMMLQSMASQEVPAWLLNADFEKSYQGVKKGHGAQFRLPNGSTRFVDYGGAMPNAPPILTEFVFPGATIMLNHEDGSMDYDFRGGAKPIQKNHGVAPPETSIQKAVDKAWKFNKKKGHVIGKSFGHELLVGTITEREEDIRFYGPNEFSDKPRLSYLAIDGAGAVVEVQADPASAATQLGIGIDSPAKVWKSKLRGRPIAANGELEVFRVVGERTLGRDVMLATVAEQGSRIVSVPGKGGASTGKRELRLGDLYDEKTNPAPCIVIGEKPVYRLESYANKDGVETWVAHVRADMEHDSEGRPLPPLLNCVVKSGVGANGPYTINDGAFVTYIGLGEGRRKVGAAGQGLLSLE